MNHNLQACQIIGIDIAKNSFAVHGADATGNPVYKATCTRKKLMSSLEQAPTCQIFMEACGGAHQLGREFQRMGHAVGLLPPHYVKPYVKRQKNDANDAAAIVEAGSRPTMRVLEVKTAATQSLATVFRARELLVRQRTQTANSIQGMLTEFGVIVAKGLQNVDKLRERFEDAELPELVTIALPPLFAMLDRLNEQIDALTTVIHEHVKGDADAQRLMQVPGIGPITAYAILAFAGDLKGFKNGREFAAWLGLTPKEHSTGERHSTGGITRMGQRDVRRLLVSGAMAVLRQTSRKTADELSPWLCRMLVQRPRLVVAVALANRMARVAWSLMVHQTDYDPTKSCIG